MFAASTASPDVAGITSQMTTLKSIRDSIGITQLAARRVDDKSPLLALFNHLAVEHVFLKRAKVPEAMIPVQRKQRHGTVAV